MPSICSARQVEGSNRHVCIAIPPVAPHLRPAVRTGTRSDSVTAARNPRDGRARRQAHRFRLVVTRSRHTGLYGLLDYASRRTVADGLTLDQLEVALAPGTGGGAAHS
jgi:hypothetical protein